MKPIKAVRIFITILLSVTACQSERYRTDPDNKLTKHAEKASDFIADQAIKMTQENIETRKFTEKQSRRRIEKHQKELNEANKITSKVKPVKKHRGNFKFY